MGDDEVATLTSLTVYLEDLIRPRIANHSARVVKLMGDGVLAEFPSVVDGDDLYGDGVNVAARLEGLAWAGDFSIGQIGFLASNAASPSELQASEASIEGRLAEMGHAVQLFLVPVAGPLETKPESKPRPDLSRPTSGQALQ
jgi:class 3 adenylate cyclase